MSIDIGNYVGIPYVKGGRNLDGGDSQGLDCYGLVRLFYAKELGIELPLYDKYISDGRKLVKTEKSVADLSDDFIEVDIPSEFDILMFTVGNLPLHLGIYLDDKIMLHSFQSGNSCVERWKSSKWERRHYASYRHTGREI